MSSTEHSGILFASQFLEERGTETDSFSGRSAGSPQTNNVYQSDEFQKRAVTVKIDWNIHTFEHQKEKLPIILRSPADRHFVEDRIEDKL